jgi:ATP-binding cassette subfamily B protein
LGPSETGTKAQGKEEKEAGSFSFFLLVFTRGNLVVMENRAAFARARRFLNYRLAAKWAALAGAVGTGVLYVALLMVLGLFADLMVNRGHIPTYRELSDARQDDFPDDWQEIPLAERTLLLNRVSGPPSTEDKREILVREWSPLPTPARRRALEKMRLIRPGNDMLVTANPRQLSPVEVDRVWAAYLAWLRDAGQDELSAAEKEYRWRAYVYYLLENRVGQEAAAAYRTEPAPASLGVLSLVVRSPGGPTGRLVGWLASWNPWMWEPSEEGDYLNYYYYLTGLLVVALGVALLRAVLMFVASYYAARATIEAATRLRRAIYHHTFRLGTLAFRALGPSEAVSVFTRHLEAVHDALYAWLTVVFREPIKFALLLLFALLVNFWLALAFLVFAVLVWLIGGQAAAHFRRQGRLATRRAADQLALIQESIKMMRLVKCYLMELFNQSRVERQLARYAGAQMRRYRGEAIYRPLFVFLGTLAGVLLLYITGLVVLSGRLGVAGAVTLATALVSLYWPLESWLENRRFLRRGRESAVVLFKFLDRSGGVGQVVGAEFLPPLSKQLEFDEVSLQEPGTGRRLLQGVSLTVQAGQRVALVGPEDAEKHALVYLIPRFLDPNSGEIRIDTKNLRWVTFDSLRAQIAIVLQHNLVFNDTVANNIGCGDPSYTLPQLIEAAKVAHAHQFIQKLPQGYETPIGEMGHSLTVGEQFRVALARAILRDPALLIVEEPHTPLDDDTKALLDDTFARVLPGRTAIFLPHRLSTIRSCDRIFVLHRGRIEAAGDHRELLAHSDLYRHLQYLEFNEFAVKMESVGSP